MWCLSFHTFQAETCIEISSVCVVRMHACSVHTHAQCGGSGRALGVQLHHFILGPLEAGSF